MERPKHPYSIHSRPTTKQNRRIYYACFRDETGVYGTAASTGCTRRDDAVRWSEARLKETRDRSEKVTLTEYAHGFWRTDAPFAQDRAAHGRAVSNGHLDISEGYTRKHLLPKWGSLQLRDLGAKAIDEWVVELHRRAELAPATINKILQCLRTILDRAVVDGHLSNNPASLVKPVRVPSPDREVLTSTEASRLLASPQAWSDYKHYAISVLAATTGMRMSEIRALRVEDVNPDHVEIRLSWAPWDQAERTSAPRGTAATLGEQHAPHGASAAAASCAYAICFPPPGPPDWSKIASTVTFTTYFGAGRSGMCCFMP
jgi:hypothetical protein